MKKLLLCMAAIMTAWCANAQLYVTGGNVTGSDYWSASNPATIQAVDGYYTFEAVGEFTMSTKKGDWDADFNPNAKQLDGSWSTSGNTASASLTARVGSTNIPPAKAGVTVTYKVNTALTTISASWSGETKIDFYLAGEFNGWKDGDATYKLSTSDYATYEIDLPNGLDKMSQGWKVTAAGWSPNFGKANNVEPTYGTEYTMAYNPQENIYIDLTAGTHLKFTYDGDQGGKLLLTNDSTQGGGGSEPTTTNFYLKGASDPSNWDDTAFELPLTTTDNKTYTYTATDAVSGEWKVSTSDWTTNFGVGDSQPVVGTLYNLTNGGYGNNITTTIPAGATVTFTYNEGGTSTLLIKAAEQGGGGSTTVSDLLVIGSFNEWDADDVTTYKMAQDGDTYTYTFASLPAATEFKIKEAVAGWDVTSWGAEGDPSATEAVPVEVTLGTAMNAWAGSGCNFKLSEAQTNVKIVFVKVADGASTLTVTADATQGGDDPVTPSAGFLVIGSFNEWDADDVTTYKMTEEGNNTYSIEMPLTSNTEFKVKEAVAGWDGVNSWGAEGDPSATEALPVEVSVGTAMNAWPGSGCNFLVTENIDQAKITFVYNSDLQEASTITVTRLSSGIEDVNVDANATAVYYNLQGIRVMQPVAGQVYIRNCNGQVSKVIVR